MLPRRFSQTGRPRHQTKAQSPFRRYNVSTRLRPSRGAGHFGRQTYVGFDIRRSLLPRQPRWQPEPLLMVKWIFIVIALLPIAEIAVFVAVAAHFGFLQAVAFTIL